MGPPDQSNPTTTTTTTTRRAYATFTPTWQRFNTPPKSASPSSNAENAPPNVSNAANGGGGGGDNPYLRQYTHVYSRRLAQLRDRCLDSAKRASLLKTNDAQDANPVQVIPRIIELPESKLATVVGTIVKTTPLRPAVDTGYHSASAGSTYLGTNDPQDLYLEPMGTTYCSGGGGGGEKGKDDDKGTKGGTDALVLEDESGRVEIVPDAVNNSNLDVNALATGVVVAVTGVVTEGTGVMVVRAVHFPSAPPKRGEEEMDEEEEAVMKGPTRTDSAAGSKDAEEEDAPEPYAMLISGLACGSPSDDNAGGGGGSLSLRRDLVLDYLAGHTDPTHDGAKVCRVIVAGGGCAMPAAAAAGSGLASKSSSTAAQKGVSGKGNSNDDIVSDPSLPIKELDIYLSELCSSGVPVDLVPGLHDPTNANWPQRPIHSCLLPNATTFEDMLGRGTNPYEARVGGRVVLGSDGRNLCDLGRYVAKVEDGKTKKKGEEEDDDEAEQLSPLPPIDILHSTLRYSHICPTGPDSLPTYPSYEYDPFVIDDTPDVYFAGNCEEFDTRLVGGEGEGEGEGNGGGEGRTRLICVPSFEKTGQAVLLNLRTLDCEVISFDDVDGASDGGDAEMEE